MNFKQFLFSATLLFALVLSTYSLQAQECPHQGLLDRIDEAMVKKDVSMMDDIYHADAVRHTPEGTVEGLEKIKLNAVEFYEQVPDAMGKNLDVVCTGDYLITRWEGTGTPQGAQKKVNVTGITISKIAEGKIVEEWEEMSSLSLMMQLGYELKPPASDAAKE